MQLSRRPHIPALFCAFAVLVCELSTRPYTTMGVGDDGAYILMARTLAATGHIVYNGWGAAILALQLYLGAAFIKLFGFSFTTLRMSTLLVAVLTAFLLQRTLVRTGITERNATLGTLTLVLSPLYLMLSVTFMSDIFGLFAIVLCLYACLRALHASTERSTIGWLCFAVATNVLCGTSRQIAWLGTLVMVPSTLWLLRAQRRVLLAGAAATFAGALLIFACMQWFKHQPYSIPVPLFVSHFPFLHAVAQLVCLFLDLPFLLLPVIALFTPEIRKSRPRTIVLASATLLAYIVLAIRWRHTNRILRLEPTSGDAGGWVSTHGFFSGIGLVRGTPHFFPLWVQVLLTLASLGGLAGLFLSLLRARQASPAPAASTNSSWRQIILLVTPFAIAYTLLLLATAATTHTLFDRYALGLLVVALPCLVRFYQERINSRLPIACTLLVGISALYGIAVTHDTFAVDRACVALSAELAANGVPPTSVDNGWEYNFGIELQHANHINDPLIKTPANGYTPVPPSPPGPCPMSFDNYTPHIHPLYGISFSPHDCYGLAPFAPVHYSRWPYRNPGTLYVVRYTPSATP
jgi:hypothetical protein